MSNHEEEKEGDEMSDWEEDATPKQQNDRIRELEAQVEKRDEKMRLLDEQIGGLEAQVAELEKKELDYLLTPKGELEKQVAEKEKSTNDLKGKNMTYCAYCDFEAPIDADASIITNHVKECKSHPLNIVIAEQSHLIGMMSELIRRLL